MSPWPSSALQDRNTIPPIQISNGSPGRSGRRDADLNRPLPALPQPHTGYEIPTLRPKPRPEPPKSFGLSHTRSFSHPFPSIFGGRKPDKKSNGNKKTGHSIETTDDDSSMNDERLHLSPPRRPSRKPSVNSDKQPVTGKCMTCDSIVRWPQGLKVYRCSICLTINDLEPFAGTRPEPNSYDSQPRFTPTRKRM